MNSWVHRKRDTCRACGGQNLRVILSLGHMPLANSFLRSENDFAEESFYPLDVYFCEDCSLMQLMDVIDPKVLFRDYIYVTGTSQTMVEHNDRYAREMLDLFPLGKKDLVVEVASNDGTLLKCFKRYGVRTLGIEPAKNLAEIARTEGIDTISEFFHSAIVPDIRRAYGPARVVIGNNVLAHVDETQDFLIGCRELISEDGLVVIEVPYLRHLLDRMEYDTIYHEHLCYFSINTLRRICDSVSLSIVRVDHLPVHGGSLRMYAGRREKYSNHAREVLRSAEEERRAGFTEIARYKKLALEVEKNRREIRSLLESLKRERKRVAGYGAPAKGNTLLNYCHIDSRLIPFTVDKNPMKVGLYTPGMHIPVLPVSSLLAFQPDYVMILAWNFAEEIIRQLEEYRSQGGRFILPIPEPKVV